MMLLQHIHLNITLLKKNSKQHSCKSQASLLNIVFPMENSWRNSNLIGKSLSTLLQKHFCFLSVPPILYSFKSNTVHEDAEEFNEAQTLLLLQELTKIFALKSKITICAPNWLPLRHSCKKWEQRSVVSWECEDEIACVLSIKCLLVLKNASSVFLF